MIDAHVVAMLNRAYDLQEDSFYKKVIPNVLDATIQEQAVSVPSLRPPIAAETYPLSFSYHCEKVTSVTKIHYDKDKIAALDRLVYGYYVGMSTGEIVQRELAELLFMCRRIGLSHDQDFNGIIRG